MKRYNPTIKYELLGYVVNDVGYYAKIWLTTYAVSPEKAVSNFRHQIYSDPDYSGWSLVTDPQLMNLREDIGPQFNRWPALPAQAKLVNLE